MAEHVRPPFARPDRKRRTLLEGLVIALPYTAAMSAIQKAAAAAKQPGHTIQPSDHLTDLTAGEAIRAIRNGELKAEDYVSRLLAQYRAHEDLNAISWIDEERALISARSLDKTRAAGRELGPLAGLVFVVKDNIDTLGYPTSAGTASLKQNLPKANAPVVESLLAQGAIVLAKTNMHELAAGGTSSNPVFGVVRNPYDPERIPGGSSGGTAAAMAARIAPAGLGTDTSGSVRIPASFCGIASLRPTSTYPKSYSDAGVTPLALYFDTIGPMARSLNDVALMHAAITGSALRAPRPLSGVRIGIPRRPFWEDLDSEVAQVCEEALDRLRQQGVTFIDLDFSELGAETTKLQRGLVIATVKSDLESYLAERGLSIRVDEVINSIASADVKAIYEASAKSKITAEELQAMKDVKRPELRAQFEAALQENELSAVLFPTEPVPAIPISPKGDTLADEIIHNGRLVNAGLTITRNTRFSPALGVPAVCFPAGLTSNKLPVGFDLTGAAGSDVDLLALAMGLEQALGRLPPPPGYSS